MHCGVAPRRPAGPHANKSGMVDVADIDLAAGHTWALDLSVATQTKIGVALGQQLGIYRAVRIMAGGATFAQSGMFENKRAGLFAMASRAPLVEPSHRQPAAGLEDVSSMRVMALDAVHFVFQQRMMLRQVELGFPGPVPFEAGRGIFARIDDGPVSAAAGGDVETAGPVTRLAACLSQGAGIIQADE